VYVVNLVAQCVGHPLNVLLPQHRDSSSEF